MIYEYIRAFLLKKGWVISVESNNFAYFRPPIELGFDKRWELFIPKIIMKDEVEEYINIIKDIYELSDNDVDRLKCGQDVL